MKTTNPAHNREKKVGSINNSNHMNHTQNQNGYHPSYQENQSGGAASAPTVMTVGDTDIRLHFSDSGSLSTLLASAFNSMLE